MRFSIAIIGGGLTATAMLWQLVDRVGQKAKTGELQASMIRIQVYEKQELFGPGFPHSDRFALPFHITNMCASDMGILEDKPDDFQAWVTKNNEDLQNRFSWIQGSSSGSPDTGSECNHYPRAIMGEYLKTRFQEAIQIAQKMGIDVDLHPESEVVDLKESGNKVQLTVKDLPSAVYFLSEADRVLLATGHWFKKNDDPHYFSSPWPAKKLLDSIPPGEDIAVIGTSLSAIETLLTLTSEGKFIRSLTGELIYHPIVNSRSFCLYSRKGLLPKVRGKIGDRKNRVLNRQRLVRLLAENRGNLTLDTIFKLLDSELHYAYGRRIDWNEIVNPTGKPVDLLKGYIDDAINGDGPQGELIWQTVLHQSLDMAREIYLNLMVEDRQHFDAEYTSVFFIHAATQPVINAEKLLALMKAGIVRVVKLGKDYRLIRNDLTQCFEFVYRDVQGIKRRDAYRYVINARGQEKSVVTDPSALAGNLIQSRTVCIEETGPVEPTVVSGRSEATGLGTTNAGYKTGSIWINPETHHIMQMGPDHMATPSKTIYAVGAMTRGQIIDASMARGIIWATAKVADDMINHLVRTIN